MRKILITGGTVFVSKYAASYFVKKGDDVYVLNRNNHPQVEGVTLIEGDRHCLGDKLKEYEFDVILDITAYTPKDVQDLVEAVGNIKQYIFISSSAVYPETSPQPFQEEQKADFNSIWEDYGTDKYEAEEYLKEHVEQYYIVRPPYLYGPMQNLYREGFVFDCARENRPFYIPQEGKMPLQFFHVEDLCRFLEILIEQKPQERVFNVGNQEVVEIKEWVKLCYQAAGKEAELVSVNKVYPQRSYFCFHDYEYVLDVSKQNKLLEGTKSLAEGLKESYDWYVENEEVIQKKPYLDYIGKNLESGFTAHFEVTLERYQEWAMNPKGAQAIKDRKRGRNLRVTVLVCGLLILLGGILLKEIFQSLMGIGFVAIAVNRLFFMEKAVCKRQYQLVLKKMGTSKWIRTVRFAEKISTVDGNQTAEFDYSPTMRMSQDEKNRYIWLTADSVIRIPPNSFVLGKEEEFAVWLQEKTKESGKAK